jgi:hypothetical protein
MRPVQIFIVGSCLFITLYRSLAPQKQPPVALPVPTPVATPVAVFKGTSNDYTPAERKAMIEAQTRARKQEEADAKAIANGTYKEPKPDATLIKQRERDLKEREKYETEEAKSEIASQEYEKRLREENPALAALQDEFARKGDIMIAEYDRYIEAKMDAGFSREDAVRIWKHDQNK